MSRKETVDRKRETVEKGLAQLATSQRARRTYQTWGQVGGYFDGDGTVILTLAMFTVIPSIDWADSYRPQLEDVRDFPIENGLRPTKVYPCGKSEKPVWHLRLYEKGGLRTALSNMLPSLNKKFGQVKATIDYFENKISGEVLLRRFNDATREGTRSGFIWDVKMPYTRAEGIAHAQSIVAKGKRASLILTTEVLDEIRELRAREATLREISFIYGVSRSSIRRAILRETAKNDS